MGVNLSFQGSLDPEVDRATFFDRVREFSREMEWGCQPLDLPSRYATLGAREFVDAKIQGLVLLPHFACEPLPVLMVEDAGILVDSFVRDEREQGVTLDPEPMVSTLFAGAAVHQEICAFLHELRTRFVTNLVVDDEAGFFDEGDAGKLAECFRQAWAALGRELSQAAASGSNDLEVAGFEYVRDEIGAGGDEFGRISAEDQQLLRDLEALLSARYGGLGLTLEPSAGGVEDLDLLMTEADQQEWGADPGDPETEAFAHGLGALLGRAIVNILGGTWVRDPQEGLVLRNVGGAGLRLNPFQIAANRLVRGPVYGFTQHLELLENLTRHLPGS